MEPELSTRAEAFWRARSRACHEVRTGARTGPRLAELHARYAEVFGDDVLASVAAGLRDPAGAGSADTARRRRLLGLLVEGRAGLLAGDALDRRLGWEATAVLDVDGEPVPVRGVRAALAETADAARRAEIARVLAEAEGGWEGADRRRVEAGWQALAIVADAGGRPWGAEVDVADVARELLARTEDAYADLLRYELERRLGLEPGGASEADGSRLRRAPWLDPSLGGLDPFDTAAAQWRELGLDWTAGGRIRIERGSRPAYAGPTWCAVLSVPDEVVLVPGDERGWERVAAVYGAIGRAHHAAGTDPELPFEDRVLGDRSVSDGVALLFRRLPGNPAWLARYARLGRLARPEPLRWAALWDLHDLRRAAALALYELELQGPIEWSDARELYVERLTAATGLNVIGEGYLAEVVGLHRAASRLRAWAVEAAFGKVLRERFDEDWFRNPRVGPFLSDHFARGHAEDAETVMARLGLVGLPFDEVPAWILENFG